METIEFLTFVKSSQTANYRNKTLDQFLDASPSILKYVTASMTNALANDQITTIRGLLQAGRYTTQLKNLYASKVYCYALGLPGYDPGPPCGWEQVFNAAPLNFYQNHASNRFRIDFSPVFYRGRLNGSVKVLVVGQDPSTDEILAQRTLVGRSGQRVQKLLHKIGITSSYLMLNTFLYGIYDQFDAEMRNISLEATLLNYRNRLFDKVKAENPLALIITFGAGADHAVNNWPGRAGITRIDLTHPAATDNLVSNTWNAQLANLAAAITPDAGAVPDLSNYPANMANAETDIPRKDLPFGIPVWHGTTGGTRSQRDGAKTIKWLAP
jgi:hypothetical protein